MNKVFKVVFNKSLKVWTAVSELAKGQVKSSSGATSQGQGLLSNILSPYYFCKLPKLTVLCISMWAMNHAYALTPEQCGNDCVMVSTAAELNAALTTGTASTILMTADITMASNIAVNMLNRPNLTIDGGGQYTLTAANGTGTRQLQFTRQNDATWTEPGTFTLQNLAGIVAGTGQNQTLIQLDGGSASTTSNVNIGFNNIEKVSDSLLAVMGGMGSVGLQILIVR